MNSSVTSTAAVKSPPGLLRRSRTSAFMPTFDALSSAAAMSPGDCSWN